MNASCLQPRRPGVISGSQERWTWWHFIRQELTTHTNSKVLFLPWEKRHKLWSLRAANFSDTGAPVSVPTICYKVMLKFKWLEKQYTSPVGNLHHSDFYSPKSQMEYVPKLVSKRISPNWKTQLVSSKAQMGWTVWTPKYGYIHGPSEYTEASKTWFQSKFLPYPAHTRKINN